MAAVLQVEQAHARPSATSWSVSYADDRLDALLSITGRMDGFLYRCRNDASYTMLYISDGILTLTGHPPADFIHNSVRDYSSAIHPDDLPFVYAAVDQALEARRNWNVDYRVVAKSGKSVWVREIGGGVFDDRGELAFLEGFVIDISDRKEIEDLNVKLLEELQVANEVLSKQKRELELEKHKSDHSANHDALTDLPNRRAFQDRLKAAIDLAASSDTAAGLLFIDLDKFKDVNDTLGHDAGDMLLQQVGAQLRALTRSEDFVARIGGDEFAFLMLADKSLIRSKAALVAERISKKLRIPVPAPNGTIDVSCTVGVATCPADASDIQGLMILSDQLMYVGKKSGRNRVVTPELLNADLPQSASRRWCQQH